MVLHKDVETAVHKQEVICHSSNCDDLGCMSRSFIGCKPFNADKRVSSPSAIAELLGSCVKWTLCYTMTMMTWTSWAMSTTIRRLSRKHSHAM